MTWRRTLLLLFWAALAGVGAGELVYRSSSCRQWIARLSGRGELLAIVHGVGIYETDVRAQPEHDLDALIVAENLRRASRNEPVASAESWRELELLRDQFGDEKTFARAMQESGFGPDFLRGAMTENLRERTWLEKQIAPRLSVTDDECKQLYERNPKQFLEPIRYRASHLFLAAHAGSPPGVVEEKRKAIQALATKIAAGEGLAQLAGEYSEDEATKAQGGDLGFFAANRVPPEFLAEVEKLQPGQISPPFQSHLGFHLVELSERRPARALALEEARGEIRLSLGNAKRALAVAQLRTDNGGAEFRRAKTLPDHR